MLFFSRVEQKVHLNIAEVEILNSFKNNKLSDSFFTDIANLSIVIKLASNDSEFAIYCKNQLFDEYWNSIWCSYGRILGGNSVSGFYSEEQIPSFDLVRGLWFYGEALNYAQEYKENFLYTELQFLEKAISFDSVHAIQRYNQYLYHLIKDKDNDGDLIEAHYAKIIKNCKKITHIYGSYAYLMLAEACAKYGYWLHSNDQFNRGDKAFKTMKIYCDQALDSLEDSKEVIHNASFGVGLSASNSFGLNEPLELKAALIEKYCVFEENDIFRIDKHSPK